MPITTLEVCAAIPPLILLEGFFSGSEIALLSADKLVLRKRAESGSRGARMALELAGRPERVLSTTLLLTNLCMIAVSALVALYCLDQDFAHPNLMAALIASPLVVLFGELIPKTVYQRYSALLAPWVALPLLWTYWAFYPATKLLSAYTTRLSRMVGPLEELITGKRRSTREELQQLLNYEQRETEIKATAQKMIKRILEFQESEARNALIPLVRVEAIADTATIQAALERFERNRHSRMPVYSDRIDNIVGILEIGSLFSAVDLTQPVRGLLSEARYVAETQALEDVMLEMRREDHDMVVVVDEYGGATGILTFEDIVEEIVGEIQDEFDSDAAPYKELSPSSWLVQARMEVEAVNESLKIDLPEGEYETLSGFLLQQFGRIPEARDELFFNTPVGSFKFTIRKATERHIESVLIERI